MNKNTDYFSIEALSASGCRKIAKNAGYFQIETKKTPAMEFGTLVHTLILEPKEFEKMYFVVEEKIDKKTKEWKELVSKAKSMGKTIIAHDEYQKALSIKDAVFNHKYGNNKRIGDLIESSDAEKEKVYLWQSFDVSCKAKMDIILPRYNLIMDLKTCSDASEKAFAKKIYCEDGYWIQSEFYRLPEELENFDFGFICVENEPPFATSVFMVDETIRYPAKERIKRYAEIYKEGIKTGKWESQYNTSSTIKAPAWFF